MEGEQLSTYQEMPSALALMLLSSPPFRDGVGVSVYVTDSGELNVLLKSFLGTGPCGLAFSPLETTVGLDWGLPWWQWRWGCHGCPPHVVAVWPRPCVTWHWATAGPH